MTDQMNLTDGTKTELEQAGGADLDYVLAFYKDGSAKLFKPEGREDVEITYIPEQRDSQGPVAESIMAARPSCIIGGRRYIPCPLDTSITSLPGDSTTDAPLPKSDKTEK